MVTIVKVLTLSRSTPRLALAFGLLVIPLQSQAEQPPAQEIGFVLKSKGEWLLNGLTLAPGQTLPAGGKIFHNRAKPEEVPGFDYITVVLVDGRLESRSWENPESLDDPIQLPAETKAAPTHWKRIVTAVMGVFPGHPEKFAQTSVRGSATNLQDAVVDLNDGQLDLRPTFKRMKKGSYVLLFRSADRTKLSGEEGAFKPLPFVWDPSAPLSLRVNRLRPGLYELSLLGGRSEDQQSTGSKAWVLVSDHAHYEQTATAFQQCVTLTEQWGEEAPPDAGRSFLRAYLDTLALQETT